MVVDDELASLKMVEQILRKRFEIITATSGEEALVLLAKNKVSLLISDQRMPGMLGTELIKTSRSLKPDLICMLLTADSDARTFIDAIRNSGAVSVVHKPWEPGELLKSVDAALVQHERLAAADRTMTRLKEASENLNKLVRT